MRKSCIWLLLLTLVLALCPIAALGEEGENLLTNPSFEELDSDGMPVGWTTDAYRLQEGYTVFSVTDEAEDGNHAVTINNLAENDARFYQTVTVEPNSLYCLSGWVKTEDILDSGHGANLSVEGLYSFSDGVYGTTDGWQYIEWYGETGDDQTEVTLFVRVGGYSGESMGKASFDNLCLQQVDAVPGDGIASLWFDATQEIIDVDPVDYTDEDTSSASPFWPWLIVMSVAFLLFMVWLTPTLTLERHELQEKKNMPLWFSIGLALAFVVRMVIAALVDGYPVDVNCFLSWGSTMAKVGPTQFYEATNFCDYPPAYVYILGLNSSIASFISSLTVGHPTIANLLRSTVIFKIIPSLCDVGMAYVVYRMAREEHCSRNQAGWLGLAFALNPAFILNSAAWCQVDGVLCFGLMLVAYLAIRRKWRWALPVYMLCVLIKPQALMLGFLGLTAMVIEWIDKPENRKGMLQGCGMALLVALAVLIPFSIHLSWDWLITLYSKTLSSYPYATVNTANFYYLFNANWVSIDNAAAWLAPLSLSAACFAWTFVLWRRKGERAASWLEPAVMVCFAAAFLAMTLMGATWKVVGTAAMALAFAIVLPMYVRGRDLRNLPLLGGLLFLLLYVLGIKMHERYLFPALIFFVMAFAVKRDRRVLLLSAVLACTVFINEGIVLDNGIRLGSAYGHLNADTKWLNMLLSAVNVACVPFGVWICHQHCDEGLTVSADQQLRPLLPAEHLSMKPGDPRSFHADVSLKMNRKDWALMLGVTLVYAVVALCNLGSTKAPQNPWKSTAYNESVTIDLGEKQDAFYMLYFAQVSYSNFSIATSDDGTNWSEEHYAEMNEGECFRWKYVCDYTENSGIQTFNSSIRTVLNGRYVRITAHQVGLILDEVIFRDLDGNVLNASITSRANANEDSPLLTDPEALLDEQDTLEGEPSWYNSTYFDEIYHARTAFEHLNGTVPYETSHPPLGKVIMSWAVAIFGMTPFGWRFAGALAGILMLPAMYLLGKQLTKRTDMAFAAMCMMTLDCMHFTQTRIATIDSFPVLFILWSYLFMLRFMQRDIAMEEVKALLPDLALSGLFMGLGIASKWIGIYAGAGLAVLFFWTLIRHIRMGKVSAKVMNLPGISGSERKMLEHRADMTWQRPFVLCLWCLLFFVFVPVVIYLLSYIPYFAYAKVTSLSDYVKRVISAQQNMFNYHSQPGLGMNHPYYSPWYEWPLIKKPMYYAMARYVPEGYSYSIFCFGNPAVWLVGLAGIAFTAIAWIKQHRYVLEGSDALMHTHASTDNVACAFVLIGLLAQYLPWVLVPRGTYIYHYFASVPFLCFGTMLLLNAIVKRAPRLGRGITAAYLLICLLLFVAFYPYASGVTTPVAWLDFMKQFLLLYHA